MQPPRKYDPLEHHLRAIPPHQYEVTMRFSELEQILGASLPESALTYRPWWGNQKETRTRPQAQAWLAAGFKVDTVSQMPGTAWARFKRQ